MSLLESTMLHLKPNYMTEPLTNRSYVNLKGKACCHLLVFLLDSILSLLFNASHIYYFLTAEFDDESNHILHVLLGAGFINIILFYSFGEAVRYLRSNFDKFFYFLSCALQKPMLFPLLFPWRFRSRIATRHVDT